MNDKQKDLGQVWTPDWVINLILDNVGFSGEAVLNKKILEPSFGAGFFFKPIISRIVVAAKKQGYGNKTIEKLIDSNVYGIEFDTIYGTTVEDIKTWASETFDINLRLPNLFNQDALDYVEGFEMFDFVVGNPPYVRIHNLPIEMRNKIKQYSHSTGTSDLYLIFYELGLKWLKSNGKLGYIAPNSWARNASQKSFRKDLIQNKFLETIIDFGSFNVFPQISTYTSIAILDKGGAEQVTYISMKDDTETNFIAAGSYESLFKKAGEPLVFVAEDNVEFLALHRDSLDEEKLGSVCRIQNGLATLGDKFFLLPEEVTIHNGNLVRYAVKASTFKGGDIEKRMFFPYVELNGKFIGITEKKFETDSPELYHYFNKLKTSLASRSLDKNSLWFWYGRSQAIQETSKRKLVITPVVNPQTEKLDTFIVPENILVYSGLFITETIQNFPLEEIQKIIESTNFMKYCSLLGKDMSGGYKNINAPLIKNYKYV